YPAVATHPGQFSVWLRSDPNRATMTDPLSGPASADEAWYTAVEAAWAAIQAGASANPAPGGYHYVDVRLQGPLPASARGVEVLRFPQAPRLLLWRERRA